MEGYLEKRSAWLQKWSVRYFRMRGRTICYYDSEKKIYSRGSIPLIGGSITPIPVDTIARERQTVVNPKDSNYRYPIVVKTKKEDVYYLCADSEETRALWVQSISNAIDGRNRGIRPTVPKVVEDVAEVNGVENDETETQIATHNQVVRKRFEIPNPDVSKKQISPPPPPSGATDPLSYLLDFEACSIAKNETNKTENLSDQTQKSVGKDADDQDVNKIHTTTPNPVEPTVKTMIHKGFASFSASTMTPKNDFKIVLTGDCLREAIKVNNIDAVKNILDQKPELNKYQDSQKQKPLHVAAIFSRKEIIEILIRNGADINAVDGQGDTALSLAPPVLSKFMKSLHEELNEKDKQ